MTTDSIISWFDSKADSYEWTNYDEDEIKKKLKDIQDTYGIEEKKAQVYGFIYGGSTTKYRDASKDGLQKWIDSSQHESRVKDSNYAYVERVSRKIESATDIESLKDDADIKELPNYMESTQRVVSDALKRKENELKEKLKEIEKTTIEDIEELEKLKEEAETRSEQIRAGIRMRELIREREDIQKAFSLLSDDELRGMLSRASIDTIKKKYYLTRSEVMEELRKRGIS